ncbi:MAG: 2-oxoacid:acceptor oxidoreductase family protein [Anaerolineales bacterium]|nr:2-oxoacid:acceptor oxidoreductase family protein [Anaerolineales bacterium]MCX7608412.1 2-oxoacid:acceptor oxidoreductase family protein [Anaerolineales bacterium]MDW8228036.1 2-oxoacid:acceptor oxidoreductase family protein [Anaerolineales bacterium]
MQTELILAGFGGQGIMFAGQVLSYAAMDIGKQVTWIPSYGPEMRGGTANCTVVISDEEIGSPVVKNPDIALVMNLPSLDKYEPLVKPGGMLVINESMVDRSARRTDIKVISIPCSEIAEQIGNIRLANMVAVGALLSGLDVLTVADVEAALMAHMPGRHRHLLSKNIEAVHRGYEYAKAHAVVTR